MSATRGMLIAAACVLAVALTLAGLRSSGERGGGEQTVQLPFTFPKPSDVEALLLRPANEEGILHTFKDTAKIQELLRLLEGTSPSYFGDPEPAGTLYKLEIRKSSGASLFYMVNDLREAGAGLAKIYPDNPGRDEVRQMPASLAKRLIEGEAQG